MPLPPRDLQRAISHLKSTYRKVRDENLRHLSCITKPSVGHRKQGARARFKKKKGQGAEVGNGGRRKKRGAGRDETRYFTLFRSQY